MKKLILIIAAFITLATPIAASALTAPELKSLAMCELGIDQVRRMSLLTGPMRKDKSLGNRADGLIKATGGDLDMATIKDALAFVKGRLNEVSPNRAAIARNSAVQETMNWAAADVSSIGSDCIGYYLEFKEAK